MSIDMLFSSSHLLGHAPWMFQNCKPYKEVCKICWKSSVTWSGLCTKNCAKQCKKWENASGGHCSYYLKCYCEHIDCV